MYDNSFFQVLDQKYPNKAFLVPNLGTFVFLRNFELDKFEGADFRYVNTFSKFKLKSTKIRHFWS